MRAFLLRCAKFGLFAVAAGAASVGFNRALYRFHVPNWGRDVGVVVLGDSNVESSVDPARLPEAISLAKGAEPLAVTYYKLRFFIDRVRAGGAIVVGVNPHNLARSADRSMERAPTRDEFFSRYQGMVPWQSVEGVDVMGPSLLVSMVREWCVPNPHLIGDAVAALLDRPREHRYAFGYRSEDLPEALVPEALEAVIGNHFPEDLRADPVSDVETTYLRRIADLTSAEGLTLVLYSAPLHPEYVARVPPALLQHFEAVLSELASRSDVVRVNLMDVEAEEERFRDFNHVTVAGSGPPTAALARVLCALPTLSEVDACRDIRTGRGGMPPETVHRRRLASTR